MVTEKIIETIRKYNMINKGQHIVIGLSGGPDSVCLFDVLERISREWNLTLHPVHVNHKFRPGAAEDDQKFTEELCKSRGIPCRSFVYDCAEIARRQKITSEEAGRLVRYSAFAEVCEEIEATGILRDDIKIAVAQNLDDRAETVLFRMLRGTGTDGLSGISYVRKDEGGRDIIRPLLDVEKKDIVAYCEERNLNPCIDKTNLKPIYSRNKIRLNLIPYLEKEYNPNLKEALYRLSESAREDREYMLFAAAEALEKCTKEFDPERCEILLSGEGLRKLHIAVRRRVLALALEKIGMNGDLSYTHYRNMEALVFSEKPSASSDLPHGYLITSVYGDVVLKMNVAEEEFSAATYEIEVDKIEREKGGAYYFDADKLRKEYGENVLELISFRKRAPGDYIRTKGGTKKLQNLFVDMKVPKHERDEALICAAGKEVLVARPIKSRARCSAKYSVDSDTKNVICIEINRCT